MNVLKPHLQTTILTLLEAGTNHRQIERVPVVKTTRVIRAADFSSKTYLETEADVEAYVSKLKAELLAAVRAGQLVSLQ